MHVYSGDNLSDLALTETNWEEAITFEKSGKEVRISVGEDTGIGRVLVRGNEPDDTIVTYIPEEARGHLQLSEVEILVDCMIKKFSEKTVSRPLDTFYKAARDIRKGLDSNIKISAPILAKDANELLNAYQVASRSGLSPYLQDEMETEIRTLAPLLLERGIDLAAMAQPETV
jgi:hypothetical protein